MHPNDNKWATPVSVGDFVLFLEPNFHGTKTPKNSIFV